MRGPFGPGLLILAALALPLWADTGGGVRATLYIAAPPGGGPVGGGGALPGGCSPPLVPIPPPIAVEQTVNLFHDTDGDGLLDPGDMISYAVEIRSFSQDPLSGLRLLVIFSRELAPLALSGGWEPIGLGNISAMTLALPDLPPGGKARVGFAALFRGTGHDTVSEVFVEGMVYGDGIVVVGDDPDTAALLDPAAVAVREVAGGTGSLFPGPAAFSKRAHVPSPYLRLGEDGQEVEFEVTYTPTGAEGVELLDFVPAPLRIVPGSLRPEGAEVVDLGDLFILRVRFGNASPGEGLELRYRAVVEGPAKVPYIATHAVAIDSTGIAFSDDPLTPARRDPTALLFPWRRETAVSWGELLRKGGSSIPVVLRLADGEQTLRWAVCGPVEGRRPGTLRFLMAQVPVRALPEGSVLGFLAARMPYLGAGEVYVPEVYGAPVFAPLSEGTWPIGGLEGRFCEDLYLPVIVELPEGLQPHLAGVIVDEGI